MRNKLSAVNMAVSTDLKNAVLSLAAKLNRSQTNIFENCFYTTLKDGLLLCKDCGSPICFKIEIAYLKQTNKTIRCSHCEALNELN